MRYPTASRGITPSHCQPCRDTHPDRAWCDYHARWEAVSSFTPAPGRPRGLRNDCIEAQSIKNSEAAGHPPRTCASCGVEKPSHRFRGGRQKADACKECEAEHSGLRWCRGCEHWLEPSRFTEQTGSEGRGWYFTRCKPCRAAHGHGVSVEWMMKLQDVASPQCGACGSTDRLHVDHDHSCCPGGKGCEKCVRGWLCHECNTAEGLLRTSARALSLARWMLTQEARRPVSS